MSARTRVALLIVVVLTSLAGAFTVAHRHRSRTVHPPSSGAPARITRAQCENGWTFAVHHPGVKPVLGDETLTLGSIVVQGHARWVTACLATGQAIPIPGSS